MQDEVVSLSLAYGQSQTFQAQVLKKCLLLQHLPPAPLQNVRAAACAALESPLDFPSLAQAVVPGDRVVVVIDPDTPHAGDLLSALWSQLQPAGIAAGNLHILQPASWNVPASPDPRLALPEEIREQIPQTRHDPTREGSCSYLASTASGERVYLSRELLDADMVLTIGPVRYDPLLGVRGTASCLYPGLSETEAIRRAQGQGHDELGPDDPRPLRQMVDEISWLLGVQFSIAVVPGEGGRVHRVLAGQPDSVMRAARTILHDAWHLTAGERAEMVLVSVPSDAGGNGWDEVAAAIDAGRRLVERNGRIVVLSGLDATPGPGLSLLKEARSPRDALKPIRKAQAPDLIAASRIAAAADWANVLLLSRLAPEVVDELFLIPVASEREVQRLLEYEETLAVVASAQHASVLSGA